MNSISSANSTAASVLNAYCNTSDLLDKLSSAIVESKSTTESSYSNKTALGRYLNLTDSGDVKAKKIFEALSIDLGGGGKTISKSQLDSYIKDAKSETTTTQKEELTALLEIQENWDEMANNKGEINFYNVSAAGLKNTLMAMVPEEKTNAFSDLQDDCNQATIDAYSSVMISALSGLSSKEKATGANSLLKTLLSGTTDEKDDANAELIAKLTNIFASYNSTSSIELEA